MRYTRVLHLTNATAQSCTHKAQFIALAPATTARFKATFGELFTRFGYWRVGCPEDLPFRHIPSLHGPLLLTLGCLGPHTTRLVGKHAWCVGAELLWLVGLTHKDSAFW